MLSSTGFWIIIFLINEDKRLLPVFTILSYVINKKWKLGNDFTVPHGFDVMKKKKGAEEGLKRSKGDQGMTRNKISFVFVLFDEDRFCASISGQRISNLTPR